MAVGVAPSWQVRRLPCHGSCGFCLGPGEAQCAIGCTAGRSLQNTSCVAVVPYAPENLVATEASKVMEDGTSNGN